MSKNQAIIGHTGFVGSNIAKQHEFDAFYNSRNIGEIAGRSFELLVFSGAQAKKWWANLHPDEDWAGIEKALVPLKSVNANHVVLISTIDVLPVLDRVDEGFDCHSQENHSYGNNRLLLEDALKDQFESITIIRLPGLFGPGLMKNIIYDLLNDNELEKINPHGVFQYYDLNRLWPDIQRVRQAGVELMHFATEPLPTASIIERFFPGKQVSVKESPPAKYNFRTKYSKIFGRSDGYILSRQEVLEQIGAFIEDYRKQQQ